MMRPILFEVLEVPEARGFLIVASIGGELLGFRGQNDGRPYPTEDAAARDLNAAREAIERTLIDRGVKHQKRVIN